MLRNLTLACAGAVLVVLALGGTAAHAQWAGNMAAQRQSDDPDPAIIGEQFFHVEFSTVMGRDGRPRLTGYVYNDYEEPATSVKLRIEPVDVAGHATGSVVEPVDEAVPAKGRAYFNVPVPDSASYRVDVVSFEFVELSNE